MAARCQCFASPDVGRAEEECGWDWRSSLESAELRGVSLAVRTAFRVGLRCFHCSGTAELRHVSVRRALNATPLARLATLFLPGMGALAPLEVTLAL